MKKSVLFLLLILPVFSIWATEVPKLLILTTTNDEVEFPIASVQKITYNDSGTAMYVHTNSGTSSYDVANIIRMTLANVPAPTGLVESGECPLQSDAKVIKDGIVYVVKEGKLFTLKGEQK